MDCVLITGLSLKINACSSSSIPPSIPEMDVSPMIFVDFLCELQLIRCIWLVSNFLPRPFLQRVAYKRILIRKQYSLSVFNFFCYHSYLRNVEIWRTFQGFGHCDFLILNRIEELYARSTEEQLTVLTNKKPNRAENPFDQFYMVSLKILCNHYKQFTCIAFCEKEDNFLRNVNTFALLIVKNI